MGGDPEFTREKRSGNAEVSFRMPYSFIPSTAGSVSGGRRAEVKHQPIHTYILAEGFSSYYDR